VGAGERAALEVLQQLKPQSLTPREVALVSTQTYRPTKQRSVWRAGLLSWSPGLLGLAASALLGLLVRHQIGRLSGR